MKQLRIFLYSMVMSIACIIALNMYYSNKVHNKYFQDMGNVLDFQKNKGIALQNEGVKKGDNLFIFGSSELSGVGDLKDPFHPRALFKDEVRDFQINLIGTGHCQSLIHAINFGAMGQELKNQKAVIIISPQWFDSEGETADGFQGNFSEVQFLKLMSNEKIDKSIKKRLAKRVLDMTEINKEFYDVDMYCRLYIKDNSVSSTILCGLSPYYKAKYYILSMKDKMKSSKLLYVEKTMRDKSKENDKGKPRKDPIEKLDPKVPVDWEKVKEDAVLYAKQKANNNEFFIDNKYYNKYIKDKSESFKGKYYKNVSYRKSPEYDDLKLLLDICKSQGIRPLFVSVPVNGKWYDYGGFDKQDRQEYYKYINKTISSYNYDIADFSNYEYEKYFLKDIMHLGWKGWVYIDEAIDEYYHSNY